MIGLSPENLPTPRQEDWKYTSLSRAIPKKLVPEAAKSSILIHRNGGQICEQEEDILLTGQDGRLHSPVLKVILEQGAELTLIERHEGVGSYWKNMDMEIILGKEAKFHHIRLIEDSVEAVSTLNTRIKMSESSFYSGFYLIQGGKLVRNEIHCLIEGEKAQCHFNGISLLQGEQHGDTTLCAEHKAQYTRSSQFFRTVLDDRARGVFQGKVYVHKNADKIEATQLSNALLLAEGTEMDTKPALEIYADDVKCTHGATTGKLDEAALFYMRSRGMSAQEARRLLIEAFVGGVVDKLEDEAVREIVYYKVQQWLKRRPDDI